MRFRFRCGNEGRTFPSWSNTSSIATLANRGEIRAVIIAASETALLAAESQGFEIVHEVPEGLEIPVQRSRIERVFFNLITNALEAMPHGGQIRIGARKAENCALIEVEDTGPGIPRAIRDRLFQQF